MSTLTHPDPLAPFGRCRDGLDFSLAGVPRNLPCGYPLNADGTCRRPVAGADRTFNHTSYGYDFVTPDGRIGYGFS